MSTNSPASIAKHLKKLYKVATKAGENLIRTRTNSARDSQGTGRTDDYNSPRQTQKQKSIAVIIMLLTSQVLPPANAAQPQVKYVFQKVEYKLASGQSVQSYALKLYRFQGGTDKQWQCLLTLWTRESHWNYKARNKRGGAYGIPQAYPAKKMARFGSDWRTNPATQIVWGLEYLSKRYDGDACAALKHHKRKGYY